MAAQSVIDARPVGLFRDIQDTGKMPVLQDLFPQFADSLLDAIEVRVDGECFFVRLYRFPRLAEVGIAMPQSRPGPKMARHQPHRMMAIDQRLIEFFLEVIGYRPLVIRFRKIRRQLDGPAKMLESAIKFTIRQTLRPPRQFLIGHGRSTAKPDRPEGMFGHLIGHRIGIFQPLRHGRDTAGAANE